MSCTFAGRGTAKAEKRIRSLDRFQPLQRFENLGLARLRLLALFVLGLDHFLVRTSYEFGIAELGIDPRDVGVGLSDASIVARRLT